MRRPRVLERARVYSVRVLKRDGVYVQSSARVRQQRGRSAGRVWGFCGNFVNLHETRARARTLQMHAHSLAHTNTRNATPRGSILQFMIITRVGSVCVCERLIRVRARPTSIDACCPGCFFAGSLLRDLSLSLCAPMQRLYLECLFCQAPKVGVCVHCFCAGRVCVLCVLARNLW